MNSIGSLILLLLVVFAVFRTPWVMLYGVAPLALAALLTLGINGLIQGSLSPATSGSAGMLFGLGIDGVVLLYLRYLEERRAGRVGGRGGPTDGRHRVQRRARAGDDGGDVLCAAVHRFSDAAGSRQPGRSRHSALLRPDDRLCFRRSLPDDRKHIRGRG